MVHACSTGSPGLLPSGRKVEGGGCMSTARRMTRSDMGFQKAEPSYGLPTPFRLASSSCCALPVMSRCSSREGVVWRPRTSHRVSSCASRKSTQGGERKPHSLDCMAAACIRDCTACLPGRTASPSVGTSEYDSSPIPLKSGVDVCNARASSGSGCM